MQTLLSIYRAKMMAVRVLVLCISLLLVGRSKVEATRSQRIQKRDAQNYRCLYQDEPMNCMNITITSIAKSKHYYYINVPAKPRGGIILVECNNICYYCRILLQKGKNIKQINCACMYINFDNIYTIHVIIIRLR